MRKPGGFWSGAYQTSGLCRPKKSSIHPQGKGIRRSDVGYANQSAEDAG